MRPIERNEVFAIGEYEGIREHFRRRVIQEKRPRRIPIGEHMTAIFENRDSVMLQIQEMLRTERITSESGVLHEIETYNDLIPREGQLSLTLFVELANREVRERMLVELAGLEDCVALEVDGVAAPAISERRGAMEGRTTAVHYLKIMLPELAQVALREQRARAAIVVSHPRYAARAELGRATLDRLAEDLA